MIEPTIVTSFYNIRKMENNPLCKSRSEETYLELANQFILKLPYNLIIFIDDSEDAKIVLIKIKHIYIKNHFVILIFFRMSTESQN